MIRFVHTADVHFGVENYGRIDPKTGIHSRLLDFYNSLSFCVDRAIAEQVDFFVFAGDAYKTAHPSPTQQRLLWECFLRLFKAEIPVVLVVGNHDNPMSFGKAHALDLFGQLPLGGFHVIAKPSHFVMQTKSGPVTIVGMPWPSRSNIALQNVNMNAGAPDIIRYISNALTGIIDDFATRVDPSLPTVFVGHLTVSNGLFSGSEKRAIYGNDPVIMPSTLARKPFDYVALGHLHRFQNLNEGSEETPIIYPGSIERIDFGERHEEKGFCLVTIHDKKKTTYEFIKTPARRFIQLELTLESQEHQTDQILTALKQQTIDDAIIKIMYHVPAGMKDTVNRNVLQQICASAFHCASIMPIHAHEPKERRVALSVGMDFDDIVTRYCASKPELKNRAQELLQKIHALDTASDAE
jgi:exonuclease SbcD